MLVMFAGFAGFAGRAQSFTNTPAWKSYRGLAYTNQSARITPQDSSAVYRAKVAYSNDYNRGYWYGYHRAVMGHGFTSTNHFDATNTASFNGLQRGAAVGNAEINRDIKSETKGQTNNPEYFRYHIKS